MDDQSPSVESIRILAAAKKIMTKLFTSFAFTKVLLSVLLANYFSFVLFYVLEIPVSISPVAYLAIFITTLFGIWKVRFRKTNFPVDTASLIFLGLALLLLTVPRLTYLIDWLPDNTTLTHSDDYARMLEIFAMTGNSNYPLMSPSNAGFPFSFYYSTLYPFSLIKLSLPFMTIKESISIGNLFYHILVLFSLYEIARLILRDSRKVRPFVFLCTLYGGLDWLASGQIFSLFGHFEWWQTQLSGNTQVSSIYTGLFWTIHHFLGAYSIVVAYAILFYSHSFKETSRKIALVLIIFTSAFYASPFAFMSIPLFVFIHREIAWKAIRSWYSLPILLFAVVPLPIFLNKFSQQSFIWSTFRLQITDNFYVDKILSLPLYVTLVPLVELLAIPIILLVIWKWINRVQRQYVAASWLFFVATYFIAYSGANNFAMRGMLVPTLVFFFVFAQHWPQIEQSMKALIGKVFKPALIILFLLSCIGTFKEFSGLSKNAVFNSQLLRGYLGLPIPEYLTAPVYAVATNREVDAVEFDYASDQLRRHHIYDFEKFISNLEFDKMENWERELLRRPYADSSAEVK